jgi:glycosyltransferase involved in cell wall biosynthesis
VKRRILCFQPISYRHGEERFLNSNLGPIANSLQSLGYESFQIALAPGDDFVGQVVDGVLLCSLHQATAPTWWQSLEPWAVITNAWGAPRFASIRHAILGATPRLLDRLDTDGARSPYICWPSYLYRDWSAYRDFTKPHFRYLAFWHSLGRGLARQTFPGLLDQRLAATLDAIPAVTAESPIATERMRRFQRRFGFSGKNIHCSPFPIALGPLDNLSLDKKQNRVISVGRWEAHQKNFPLLLRVLNNFLALYPDWDAMLPGSRHPQKEKLLQRYCAQTRGRIQVTGPLPNQEIQRQMAASKIFLMASRHESFGIAAAEALCLGCSVVGPAHIPSIPWFCGSDSGTVAATYTKNGLVDALSAEAETWESPQRDAPSIANVWRNRVGAECVSRHVINMLQTIKS